MKKTPSLLSQHKIIALMCFVFAGTKILSNTSASRKRFCEEGYSPTLPSKSMLRLQLQHPCIDALNSRCEDQGLLQRHYVVPSNIETAATKREYIVSQKRSKYCNIGDTLSTAKECCLEQDLYPASQLESQPSVRPTTQPVVQQVAQPSIAGSNATIGVATNRSVRLHHVFRMHWQP